MKLTEQQKNCPYCHGGWADRKLFYDDGWGTSLSLSEDNRFDIEYLDDGRQAGFCTPNKVNYCPICGRKLQ